MRSAPHLRRLAAAFVLSTAVLATAAPDAGPSPAEPLRDTAGSSTERRLLDSLDPPAIVRNVRDAASEMVDAAMNFLGAPYRRGGNSVDSGFDCSGFTRHVFESSVGLLLPRRADEQAAAAGLVKIGRHELRPGDLVFFNTMRRTFSHVGIYVGDDKFIHAPRSGTRIRVEDITDRYWSRRFTGARRADLASSPLPAVR